VMHAMGLEGLLKKSGVGSLRELGGCDPKVLIRDTFNSHS